MNKGTILIIAIYFALVLGKKLKAEANTQDIYNSKMDPPTDYPETLYKAISEYRKSNANIMKSLNTEGSGLLLNMAETEVWEILKGDTFGQFSNFDLHAAQFSSFTEVVCELAENHNGNAYQAAFDLWSTDASILKEFKNEYTYADANCYNGWTCVLMLATPKQDDKSEQYYSR